MNTLKIVTNLVRSDLAPKSHEYNITLFLEVLCKVQNYMSTSYMEPPTWINPAVHFASSYNLHGYTKLQYNCKMHSSEFSENTVIISENMPSFRMLCCVTLLKTDISDECIAFIIRVTRIVELDLRLTVTSNSSTHCASVASYCSCCS
jgi:hypothetical protein